MENFGWMSEDLFAWVHIDRHMISVDVCTVVVRLYNNNLGHVLFFSATFNHCFMLSLINEIRMKNI